MIKIILDYIKEDPIFNPLILGMLCLILFIILIATILCIWLGDYTGLELLVPEELRTGGKKWTTEEIFKEVKGACYQLVKGGDKIEKFKNIY